MVRMLPNSHMLLMLHRTDPPSCVRIGPCSLLAERPLPHRLLNAAASRSSHEMHLDFLASHQH